MRWEEPGYVVSFTTRRGGVSEGAYESLNLTAGTGDDLGRVEENRRRACARAGVDAERLSFNRQVHTAEVHEAGAQRGGGPGDGLWTDVPGVAMLAMTADCLPIAVARTGGTHSLAVLHAGWRGLSEGIVATGVAKLGDGPKSAVVGPAIGPCCYEVGEEVSARFDRDLTADGRLDLRRAAERALRAAGVERVDHVDLCTCCHPELYFSHRRDGLPRGAQGVIGALA
jgi:polyphenol oxidase